MKTHEVKLKVVTDGDFCGEKNNEEGENCCFLNPLGKNDEYECFRYGSLENPYDDGWNKPLRCLKCLEEFK